MRPTRTSVLGPRGHRLHRVPDLRQVRLGDHHQTASKINRTLVARRTCVLGMYYKIKIPLVTQHIILSIYVRNHLYLGNHPQSLLRITFKSVIQLAVYLGNIIDSIC